MTEEIPVVEDRFADVMVAERVRLTDERNVLLTARGEIDAKIVGVEREMLAIAAYESTKAGKVARASTPRRAGGRRGSRRNELLALIGESPQGIKRGEIIVKLDVKGNKTAEMSISNALTALVRSGAIVRQDGHYLKAA